MIDLGAREWQALNGRNSIRIVLYQKTEEPAAREPVVE